MKSIGKILKSSIINNDKLITLDNSLLAQVQDTLFEMLVDINEVCARNDIKWGLIAGSLLGAVRYNDFIPWDDDVDIYMLRNEYTKLERIFNNELGNKYILKKPGDKGYIFHFPQIQKRDTKLQLLESSEDDNSGLFIDLFIYDNVSDKNIFKILHGLSSTALLFIDSTLRMKLCEKNILKYCGDLKEVKSVLKQRTIWAILFSFRPLEYWPMERKRASVFKIAKQELRHFFTRINSKKIDKFIVPSIYTFSFYRNMGIPANKCIRCFNASEIKQEKYESNYMRNSLLIPKEDKVILYLGRIETYKGINELINVFEKINCPSWHLVICGPGDAKVKSNNNNIHLIGSVSPENRGFYYAMADLFILPNTYKKKIEPWGLTVNEAMAFGLPILATEATGSGLDLVFPGINGFLMNSEDLENEIKYYLKLMLSDDELLLRMSKSSRNIVSNYTFDNMARAFLFAATTK